MAKDFGLSAILKEEAAKRLREKWGSPESLRATAAVSILGGELVGAYEQITQQQINDELQSARQNELLDRASKSVANIMQQGQKIGALQKTAFIKSGVKLEGSALDVVAETAQRALEASKIRQRETDYDIGQIEIAKAIQASKAKSALFGSILNTATSSFLMFGSGGSRPAQEADERS